MESDSDIKPDGKHADADYGDDISVLSIPADVWPSCVGHADIDALLALPCTCRAMHAAFGTPRMQLKALERLLAAARARDQAFPTLLSRVNEEGELWVTDQALYNAPPIADGLAARSQALQLRGLVRDMLRRAIRAHSAEAMRACVEDLDFDLYGEMGWVLHQLMRYDFADGVDIPLTMPPGQPFGPGTVGLTGLVRPLLPYYGTPLKMLPRAIHDVNSNAFVPGTGAAEDVKSVLRMEASELPAFNPIFLGVLFHSLQALPRLLVRLRAMDWVQMVQPLPVELDPAAVHAEDQSWRADPRDERVTKLPGHEYVRWALGGLYVGHRGSLKMPQFDCMFSVQQFSSRGGTPLLAFTMRNDPRKQSWSLLQMELRRPDPMPQMVGLLLRALSTAMLPPADSNDKTSSTADGDAVDEASDDGVAAQHEEAAAAFARVAEVPGTASDRRSVRQRNCPGDAWYKRPPEVEGFAPSAHPDGDPLRRIILAKRRAIDVMRSAGEGETAAQMLDAAIADARASKAAQAARAPASREEGPNDCLTDAGWFGVSAEPERVASFEAAAALIERAFGLSL